MKISVRLSTSLREYCGEASELTLTAGSVRAALAALERDHPTLYRSVCDETGAIRRHINVFVNDSFTQDRDGLDTPLVPGDVVTIFPAVSGG